MKLKNKETIIIIVAWILIYASTPLYMYYALLSIGQDFNLTELWDGWISITAFCLLFMLNHYVLIPRLFSKKRYAGFVISVIVALSLFIGYLATNDRQFRPRMERDMHNKEMAMRHKHNGDTEHRKQKKHHKHGKYIGGKLLLTPPSMARLIIALLMIGADFGVIAWTNEQKMRQRLLLLEQQNLLQELQHLRYQINPHFFMNTLNNIHALIDLDQERAKRAIIELSRLMRYTLYEGNGSMATLQNELEFLNVYISLMQLRFGNKVEVSYETPQNIPAGVMVPPLIFATFIENSFKHGISYLQKSYIHIRMTLEDDNKTLFFSCVNSRSKAASATEDGHHGIGLVNVRKRLDLQYGNTYALDVNDTEENKFEVTLRLPVVLDEG